MPLLEKALADKDPETRLYALWSLALIGNPSSAEKVRPLLESEDPGVRKTAAYAAGRMEDGEAIPALKKLLQDPVVDVRWNAALALATLDDPAGKDVLLGMTDRDDSLESAVADVRPDGRRRAERPPRPRASERSFRATRSAKNSRPPIPL